MHHIVQHQMSTDSEFDRLLDALHDAKVTYSIVKVIPFAHEIMPDVNPDGKVMVWGAHTMCRVAKKKGWVPGAFLNENFDIRVLGKNYGINMLNADAICCTFGTIPEFDGARFIRPVHDNKSFTGTVVQDDELARWKDDVTAINDSYSTLTSETPVIVASPKQLDCEARFFVIDGEVVTGSTYRVFGNQVRNRIDSGNAFGMPMWEFAQKMVNIWQPHKAFVIDIALVNGEYKVIEINCLNASGLYNCDVSLIVRALEIYCSPIAQR